MVGVNNALPEIWAFGLRNPWRYNFDDVGAGNTGALVIADVGQGAHRGDQLRAGRPQSPQLRLEHVRRLIAQSSLALYAGVPADDVADLRVHARGGPGHHRRLRLPGRRARRLLPGPLLLLRLRRRPHLVDRAHHRRHGRRRGVRQPRPHRRTGRAVQLRDLIRPRRRRRALLHGLRRNARHAGGGHRAGVPDRARFAVGARRAHQPQCRRAGELGGDHLGSAGQRRRAEPATCCRRATRREASRSGRSRQPPPAWPSPVSPTAATSCGSSR